MALATVPKYRDFKQPLKHGRYRPPEKTTEERYPPYHEFRCMLNDLIDHVVLESKQRQAERKEVKFEYDKTIKERLEKEIEIKELINYVFDVATGAIVLPVKKSDYRYVMRHIRQDAIERTEQPYKVPCPEILPSELRRRAEKEEAEKDPYCKCLSPPHIVTPPLDKKEHSKVVFDPNDEEQRKMLLPSELRALEELRKCKCDTSPESDSWFGFSIDSQTTPSYAEEHDEEYFEGMDN